MKMDEIISDPEVKRIIEKVRLNLPSPEEVIRECRRNIYKLDRSLVDVYGPTFLQDMDTYKEARKAFLKVIRESKKEIKERLNSTKESK